MGTGKRTGSIIGPATFAYAYETRRRKDRTVTHLWVSILNRKGRETIRNHF
uniref:Uncharacterized protein n=1 Tax=Picea glauca TaxID=3330 RepID=A0A101LZG9_PICGL|nr:hypothetical protein ABT39_MTgene5187 [Picea glauca]